MTAWGVLNSNFFLTLVGLIWGSLAAGWISSMWQRRQNRHEMKLKLAQDILLNYHTYLRILHGDAAHMRGDEFDRVHAQILSSIKMSGLLYRDKTVRVGWDAVVNDMTMVRKHHLNKEHTPLDMNPIYKAATAATEAMFKELQG